MLLLATGLVLGERHQLRYGIGLLVLTSVSATVLANIRQRAGTSPDAVVYAIAINAGFVGTAALTLWVCRVAGYRLKSTRR